MLLAIDVGNTQTHVGMFREGELVEHWRFATRREATGDELATTLVSLLALRDLRLADVDGAVVSSVVPQLGARVRAGVGALLRRRAHGDRVPA